MTLTVPVMTPQNFTLAAGYNQVITFNVDPNVVPSLVDTVIWWRVYEQAFGIPVPGWSPIIVKTDPDVVSLDSPLSFMVQMKTADTIDLLRNYYHEATIFNALNEMIGGSFGIMTVIASVNRESGQ
jgi:hypothetical protein